MRRYQNGTDWVELEGVAPRTMRELNVLYENAEKARALVMASVKAGELNNSGGAVDLKLPDWPLDLTLAQWDWLRECMWKAARDETLDPEASRR